MNAAGQRLAKQIANGPPRTCDVPATIEDARARLTALAGEIGALAQLLTAAGWYRAAVVYAFTYEAGQGARTDLSARKPNKLTPAELARQGIFGLRSKASVYELRGHWKTAIARGWAVHVEPGDAVALPTQAYPPVDEERASDEVRRALDLPAGVKQAVALALANDEAVSFHPDTRDGIWAALAPDYFAAAPCLTLADVLAAADD
jgi:hypothetical protein